MKLVSFAVAIIALAGSVQAEPDRFKMKAVPLEDITEDLKTTVKSTKDEIETFEPINLVPNFIKDDMYRVPPKSQGHPRTIEDLEKVLDLNLREKRNLEDLKNLDHVVIQPKYLLPIEKFEALKKKDEN